MLIFKNMHIFVFSYYSQHHPYFFLQVYLPQILPHMLRLLINDRSENRTVTYKV